MEFLISRLGMAVLSLATIIVVARLAPVATVGSFTAGIAYAQLLFMFVDLGSGPALVRSTVRGDRNERITVYVWTRGTLTVLTTLVGAAFVFILFPPAQRVTAWVALGFLATSFYGITAPIGQVMGDARRYRRATLTQGVIILVSVTAISLFVRDPTAPMLAAAYALGGALTTATTLIWVRQHMVPLPWRQIVVVVRANLRELTTLGFASATGSVYYRIDQALLLRIAGTHASAQYGIATRILDNARIVPSALQLAIGGFLAERLQGDGFSARDRQTLRTIATRGGPGLCLIAVAFADGAVAVIGGGAYAQAGRLAVIICVALSTSAMGYIVITSAVMAGRDRLYLLVALAALGMNVAANAALIPVWGAWVCAVVTVATECLVIGSLSIGLTPARGGMRMRDVVGVVAFGACAAAVKSLAMHVSLPLNVAVSAVLVAVGGLLLKRAYAAIRSLPAHGTRSA